MRILLIGSGGREHAFAWKIAQSKQCQKLFIAPGNAGTAEIGENIPISPTDFESIKQFCLDNTIGLIVVGPEEPLVKGLGDFISSQESTHHIPVIGPGSKGAILEGSKDFSKQFMKRNNIPSAAYETFSKETLANGLEYIRQQKLPVVLKADGLAAGKGVLICPTYEEAEANFKEMLLNNKFGDASSKVVIEEFLSGIELSVFVATDGISYKILPEAKDYKRIGENDSGPNTGGMGAVSPVPFADEAFMKKVEEKVVKPTIQGLKNEQVDYTGFLFIGLMNQNGEPFVIEYNVRMGDPETQSVLPRIKSDFLEMLQAMGSKKLADYTLEIENFVTTTVVMVAGGYPEAYEKGKIINGLDQKILPQKSLTFHAGTQLGADGKIISNGGRVLGITGKGESMEEAIANAYERISQVTWEKVYYRKDIGQDILHYGK